MTWGAGKDSSVAAGRLCFPCIWWSFRATFYTCVRHRPLSFTLGAGGRSYRYMLVVGSLAVSHKRPGRAIWRTPDIVACRGCEPRCAFSTISLSYSTTSPVCMRALLSPRLPLPPFEVLLSVSSPYQCPSRVWYRVLSNTSAY